MRKVLWCLIIVGVLLSPAAGFSEVPGQIAGIQLEVPGQIAGIQLGADIDQYRDTLQMNTSLPVRHMEYVSQVDINPPFEGYSKGYILYGNCDKPGRIVKIKLKYERKDQEFFDELLKRFKRKFGQPDQYLGDVFHAFAAWKWFFKDKDGNRVSLILQHNSADMEEYSLENSVKLTATSLIEKEATCYEQKNPERKAAKLGKAPAKSKGQGEWVRLLPE